MTNQVFLNNYELVSSSFFFDRDWYLATYTDVAKAGLDPVGHYLDSGFLEGRDPSRFFSTNVYFSRRPDIREMGMNPLVHFLRYGLYEMPDDFAEAGVRLDEEEISAQVDREVESEAHGGVKPLAVFVTHDMNIGGAPVLLATIGEWFQKHTNYEVRFVSMGGGPLSERFEQVAPLHVVGNMTIEDAWTDDAKARLRAFLGREPAFTFLNSIASGHYFKINPYNTPVFSYIHEMKKIIEMFPSQFDLIVENAAHIFCGGQTVHRLLTREYGVDDQRLSNRPAFIPADAAMVMPRSRDKQRLRRRLNLPAARKMVVACGVAHWRKQPEVFVRMAADLIGRGRDLTFVWVGHGEDLPAMQSLAADLGISEHIHFPGFQDKVTPYLAAADVFALTSSEDPFPLVCLDAALQGTPSVVFREATGMTALVEPEGEAPGGTAVPLNNNMAFFDAVDELLLDDVRREAYARTARDRVLERFSETQACMELLGRIRTVAGLRPHVSVVVPNYNCGPYLKPRLDSVGNQTFKDVEILLMDDKSTDGSEAMLTEFAKRHPLAKVMLAKVNGGSVFAAWERGIHAASGNLIWIAEADDWCEDNFLHEVLKSFGTSGVHLAHGRSIPINSKGEIAGDWNDLYLDRISPGRWRKSFVSPTHREVTEALGHANTIPNGSAVVTLRQSALRAVSVVRHFRLAGDWAFYLTAAAGGRIAYVHEAVNYHRRHDTTVTKSLEGKQSYFQELVDVGNLVRGLYGPSAEREEKFHAFLKQEAQRFGRTEPLPEPRDLPDMPRRAPGIMYGVGDLNEGGAQMFAMRFVNAWAKIPATSVLFMVGQGEVHPTSLTHLSPEVPLIRREEIEAVGLPTFMKDWGLDVAVTGHWWADRQVAHWLDLYPDHKPWVVVMHGCYENVLSQPEAFPGYEIDFAAQERQAACWVWTADKNQEVFNRGLIKPVRSLNIPNGFEPVEPKGLTRREIGIPDDAIVFTLASRAIESKGWLAAVEALGKVRAASRGRRDIRLLLIGNGPVAEQLAKGDMQEGIHLVEHTSRLADYISVSDVCLLPSWFAGESLPLVLIEFLAQGKPAIVSDIGMCPWAVDADVKTGAAGIVLPRGKDGTVAVGDIAAAMETLAGDPALLKRCGLSAVEAFKKFDMRKMVDSYRRLFEGIYQVGA